MGKPANYVIEKSTADELIIRDVGPWDVHLTVTNDAEGVVARLFAEEKLGKRRLGYYDSEGNLDELVHDYCGNFVRFGPGFSARVGVPVLR